MKKVSKKYDSMRKCNTRIVGIQGGEEKENGAESVFKQIIAEKFQNLGKEREICVEEASRSPRFVNVKRPTARHIVVKLAKMIDKERMLRAARQKNINYKGTLISFSMDFSAETLQARREWNDIFKSLKDKNLQPRILYLAKISFRYEGEIKTFPDKQKLRNFVAMRHPLQEILKMATIFGGKKTKGKRGHKTQS
uniref:L1 transposable element RRM domain-containing protein n=1 Tax=Equus caballus TaxID=9796 RepID=A0A9L0TSD6_HORSE